MGLDRRALIGSGLALAAVPGLARAAALPAAPGDHVLGSAKARVQVVEYASLSCGHCAHWNEDVFPSLKARYIDTGKVRYVFREFLTPPAEFAGAGFLLALRVGEPRYFEVIDAIFRRQRDIFQSGDLWGGLLAVAKSFGLTEAQFEAAMADKAALAALNARVARAGERDRIQVTPTLFVNGQRFETDMPFDALAKVIDAAAKA